MLLLLKNTCTHRLNVRAGQNNIWLEHKVHRSCLEEKIFSCPGLTFKLISICHLTPFVSLQAGQDRLFLIKLYNF